MAAQDRPALLRCSQLKPASCVPVGRTGRGSELDDVALSRGVEGNGLIHPVDLDEVRCLRSTKPGAAIITVQRSPATIHVDLGGARHRVGITPIAIERLVADLLVRDTADDIGLRVPPRRRRIRVAPLDRLGRCRPGRGVRALVVPPAAVDGVSIAVVAVRVVEALADDALATSTDLA